MCFLPVPSGSYPQALEDPYNQSWPCRSHSSSVQCSHPRVPHGWSKTLPNSHVDIGLLCCWLSWHALEWCIYGMLDLCCLLFALMLLLTFVPGTRVGRKCLQRLEGEAYHSPSLAAGHSWWWGVGLPHQGHHCWRRWVDGADTPYGGVQFTVHARRKSPFVSRHFQLSPELFSLFYAVNAYL